MSDEASMPAPAGHEMMPETGPAAAKTAGRRARRPTAKARRVLPRRPLPWSKKRQAIFLETMGRMCNVSAACRASGLSDDRVYRRRRSDPGFLAAWNVALREGYDRLELEILDRSVNGTEKVVWHGGKPVGSVREYNDAMALALYRLHAASAGRIAPPPADAPPAGSREDQAADIARMLSEMNKRMGGDG